MAVEIGNAAGSSLAPLKWHALVIDDSVSSCAAVGYALGLLGGQITVAHNGFEGVGIIQIAEKAKHPFDLVLMRIDMRSMSGMEAARLIRKNGATLPIVGMSHSLDPQLSVSACVAAGFNEVVDKPITCDQLSKIVHRYINGRKAAQKGLNFASRASFYAVAQH